MTDNPVIALIGAGQIGSRHLQALTLLDRPAAIYVVEPSVAAKSVAQDRLKEIDASQHVKKVEFLSSLSALPSLLDVAIVATSAAAREAVIKELLAHSQVRYLILEKVLFQKLETLERVGKLLEKSCVKAWVNCTRRMWPLYRDLKPKLAGPIQIRVTGSQWGLGCNAIHFMDLAAFLAGSSDFSLSTKLLDKALIPSKRAGFMEFTGTLEARLPSQSRLVMTSSAQANLPFKIEIETQGRIQPIDESTAPPQSRFTHLIVQELLDSGSCGLPSYEESSALHRLMLGAFLDHMRKNGQPDAALCPIT